MDNLYSYLFHYIWVFPAFNFLCTFFMSAQINCKLLIPQTGLRAGSLERSAQIPHITQKEAKNQSRLVRNLGQRQGNRSSLRTVCFLSCFKWEITFPYPIQYLVPVLQNPFELEKELIKWNFLSIKKYFLHVVSQAPINLQAGHRCRGTDRDAAEGPGQASVAGRLCARWVPVHKQPTPCPVSHDYTCPSQLLFPLFGWTSHQEAVFSVSSAALPLGLIQRGWGWGDIYSSHSG